MTLALNEKKAGTAECRARPCRQRCVSAYHFGVYFKVNCTLRGSP